MDTHWIYGKNVFKGYHKKKSVGVGKSELLFKVGALFVAYILWMKIFPFYNVTSKYARFFFIDLYMYDKAQRYMHSQMKGPMMKW